MELGGRIEIHGEEFLKREYPGRGIIIGFKEFDMYAVYFLMGRSPSSKARILEAKENVIYTKPTDPKVLAEGNPELLLYNALASTDDLITVSNGRQTDTIFLEQLCRNESAIESFNNSLRQWRYEPDEPNYTPRISGIISKNCAYLGIIRNVNGKAVSEVHNVPEGTFQGITTYTGFNDKPLPSYTGEPFIMDFPTGLNAKELAEQTWKLLNPNFKVSLAALVIDSLNCRKEHCILP